MPHSVHSTPGSVTPLAGQQENLPLRQRYWNANLPEAKWTALCPAFLLGQSQKNIGILSSNEKDYEYMTWPQSKELVGKTPA